MTQSQQQFDIAIIGGGMVGASLALMLARQQPHWKVALLEAQAVSAADETGYQSSFDARSTAIAQGSVEILQALGVWERLARHATAIGKVHVSDAGHFMGGLIAADTYGLNAVGYVIENAWIGRVLLAQLQRQNNISYLAPVRVEKIIPRSLGARLQLNSAGQAMEIDCKLAVVADGGDSPLRKMLGIDTTCNNYKQTALIANVAYSEAHKGIAYERFTEQGPLALLPLGEASSSRESALVLTLPDEQASEVIAFDDQQFLQHLQQRFGYRLGRFLRVSKRHVYPLQLVTANEQVRSHIVVIGNAAHFLHPVAGQGFNLSLRDCSCLVAALVQGEAREKPLGELSVLQEYAHRQQLDQALTIEFSDKLVRLFSSSSLPLIALRHLGFIGLEAMPGFKSQFAAQTMGTAGVKFL